MSGLTFSKDCKLVRVSNAVAAGTTDVTPAAGVDTAGYDGVCFLFGFGTITSGAVTSVKAQSSSDAAVADAYSDIAGSSQTVADTESNKTRYLDILRPPERYVLPIVDRGTQNAVLDGIWAILYRAHGATVQPVTHDTSVSGGELLVAPLVGTA
jgi:hypothetical protein